MARGAGVKFGWLVGVMLSMVVAQPAQAKLFSFDPLVGVGNELTATVKLSLANDERLDPAAADLIIQFDTAKLSYIKESATGKGGWVADSAMGAPGTVYLSLWGTDPLLGPADHSLASLKFDVLGTGDPLLTIREGTAPVPLPDSLLLLGSGLVGLIGGGAARRRGQSEA